MISREGYWLLGVLGIADLQGKWLIPQTMVNPIVGAWCPATSDHGMRRSLNDAMTGICVTQVMHVPSPDFLRTTVRITFRLLRRVLISLRQVALIGYESEVRLSGGSYRGADIDDIYVNHGAPLFGQAIDQHLTEFFGRLRSGLPLGVRAQLLAGNIAEPENDVGTTAFRSPVARVARVELVACGIPHIGMPLSLDLDWQADMVANGSDVRTSLAGHVHLRLEPDGLRQLTRNVFHQAVAAEVLASRTIFDPICGPHVGVAASYSILESFNPIREVSPHVVDGLRQPVSHDGPHFAYRRCLVFEVTPGFALKCERVFQRVVIARSTTVDNQPL